MSKNPKPETDDLDDIMNEVDDYEVEGGKDNVDDILKEDFADQTISMNMDYGEPVHISDLPAPRRQFQSLAHSSEHPLDMIEQNERDISLKMGNLAKIESKFLMTNYDKGKAKDYPNMAYTVLETLSNRCFPGDHRSMSSRNEEYWGAPKCLAVRIIDFLVSHVDLCRSIKRNILL